MNPLQQTFIAWCDGAPPFSVKPCPVIFPLYRPYDSRRSYLKLRFLSDVTIYVVLFRPVKGLLSDPFFVPFLTARVNVPIFKT
jgi:hypothetical protein